MRNDLISNIFWLCTSPPTLLGSIEAIQATLGSNCSEHNFPRLSLNPREVILSQQRDRHLRAIETANYLQALTENTDNYPEHQPTVLLMVPSVGSNSNSTGPNSPPPRPRTAEGWGINTVFWCLYKISHFMTPMEGKWNQHLGNMTSHFKTILGYHDKWYTQSSYIFCLYFNISV